MVQQIKDSAANRARLLARLFSGGIPVLWCPSLTHFDRHGAVDGPRIAAHLQYLARHVRGFLIPGSTGDGWELTEAQTDQLLLEAAFAQAQKLDLHLLIGVLKRDARDALTALSKMVEKIKSRANASETATALAKMRVSGFAVCAPSGKALGQEEIGQALTSILELGLPTALYQLPQVTQNEIGPDVASSLATQFDNFILFKDSSGGDRVVLSGKDLAGVWTLRGAEGNYTRWLKTASGPYDGFLLGSANFFAAQYAQIISGIAAGRLSEVQPLSERVTAVVAEVAALVTGLRDGHPFSNANKALDHFLAFGPRALQAPPPWLRGGSQLPLEVLRATGEILSRHGLMPAKGYLE